MKEDFLDDRVIIPDDIKKMTVEELEAAIKELEQELKEKKKQHEIKPPLKKAVLLCPKRKEVV